MKVQADGLAYHEGRVVLYWQASRDDTSHDQYRDLVQSQHQQGLWEHVKIESLTLIAETEGTTKLG